MKRLVLYKFDPLAHQEAPGIIIEIAAELPSMEETGSLKDAEIFYDSQAKPLVNALRDNLPQGVLYRVLYRLMEYYAKDVLYRGKHGK